MHYSANALILCAALVFSHPLTAQDSVSTQPKGKFSGYMFGDYYYNVQQKDTSKKDLNGFQFRRIYFTYDYAIAPNFDTRFRLEASQAELFSNGKIGVFVKDAWLKWKNIFDGSDFVFGMSPTPTYEASEDVWGYRPLEKTIMDLRGIVAPRDIGVDLKGKLIGNGTVNYWLKVGNNSGNVPESDKFKRFYGQIHIKPTPQVQLIASADFDAGPRITDLSGQPRDHNGINLSGFAGYREPNKYSLGIEGFYRTIQNNFHDPVKEALALDDQTTIGVSLFAWGAVSDDVRLVGRFDLFDPNTSLDKDGIYLFIGALDYAPSADVHIMPNIYFQSYQADFASDVIARITFYYIFK
jgi:hypothetical protein